MSDDKYTLPISVINFNNYTRPIIEISKTKDWVLNGENNSYFKYIKQRYIGSPTNAGIIKSYVNYIIGDGIKSNSSDFNPYRYLSKKDLRLICNDYKLFGQYSVQIIWSIPSKLINEDPKIIKIKYIPTFKLGLNVDSFGEVNGYWYSFDWENQGTYTPKFYPKFDGSYKDNQIEILTIFRPSSEDFFPQPDYESGFQSAEMEEELSNSSLSYIKNGFSTATILHAKLGVPPTEQLKRKYQNEISSKITGSSNVNRLIFSFTDGDYKAIEIEQIQPKGLDTQLQYFAEQCKQMLFDAHSVTSPILFASREGGGLGSNSDEMKEALKVLYRSSINPMREVILDGLNFIFKSIDRDVDIDFEDFEDLREVDKNNEVDNG